MSSTLTHRGPDGGGVWADASDRIALAHRRLAIIDLTDRASQPMRSEDGRFVLVYNGEIYNYRELRGELEAAFGCTFRSDSDTEVLLTAFEKWGPACVRKFNGMFAFAIYDTARRTTYLVRDRLGVKPLYYVRERSGTAFASELRSILTVRGISREFSPAAVCQLVREGYVGGTHTVIQGIEKVPPGTVVTISESGEWSVECYWSVEEVYGREERPQSEDAALDSLDALLSDAFTKRIIADVPVGVYLSGGVDSTLLAGVLVKNGVNPHAFTLAIRGGDRDESDAARATASTLGIQHTVEELHLEDIKRQIRRVADVYDEPLGDPSALPTLAVSQAAARHVKVVLSADGGDELFGGYRRYAWTRRLETALGIVPRCVAHGGARFMGHVLSGLSPRSHSGRGWSKLADVTAHATAQERYREWNASCGALDLASLFPNLEPASAGNDLAMKLKGKPLLHQLMAMDVASYLAGDILTKVDRATMAVSIEGREPFLDYRIVEFAARAPLASRINRLHGKVMLKQLLTRYNLRDAALRPKKGFSIPLVQWMRSDWKKLISQTVHSESFKDVPGINARGVDTLVRRFDLGDLRVIPTVYVLLCFALWRQRWAI